jgi:shikimate 5-dehydrogenase
VFDTVYNPIETRLLREAAAAGCRTVNGLEMFVNQAVEQFEGWTGQPAPRDVMRAVVEARLRGQSQ